MKRIAACSLLLIGWAWSACAAVAAAPETFLLPDLVNRPDRWPAAVTFQRDIKFNNGAVVHQGDKLRVVRFDGSRVLLIAPGNLRFMATVQDCGLLDAANQAWAALTPAQRAVDPDSLAADRSLWPLRVAATTGINCKFGKLPAGTEVGLLGVSSQGADIAWPNSPDRVTVDFGSTDVMARARQLALIDPNKRASRIAAALQGILVDADGKACHDEHLGDKKIFALYFGASWCAPCRAFSPDFVKFLDDALPRHPELAVVLLSNDQQPDQMLAYMKDEKMPFPAVPLKDWTQSSLLSGYAAEMIPQLVIVDRFGKVLASNDDNHGNRGDPKDTIDALGKLLTAPTGQ
jgi:nucleoredoxin